ncbi:MAG TPA: tyrosinase family protein [Stellaceae bacterium]|nr:tyrosinase family protein [Stellaceae bacterium]
MKRKLTRRALLAAGAAGAALDAIPFPIWIKQQAWAQGGTRVRYNAASTEGKAMLEKYQAGVNRMMTMTPEQNPLSWVFQWYTHWVKEPPGMASELNRIYPQPTAPYRALAQQMWETCQAHGGENEDFFLPWHRMFVYFFELIVRQASYEPSFTLPYWNYSNPAQRSIPPEFAVTSSPLYRVNRNPGVNTGSQIPANLVTLGALNETVYSANGADEGFCATLDFGIHGNVHVWVGNSQGMGSVPWAANDPIFWMHHCNIDRLWASWNKHGCKNPTYAAWLNQQFVFADIQGNKVVATVKDFNDISQLNYTYQEFEPVSAACPLHLVKLSPAILAILASETVLPRTALRVNMLSPPAQAQPRLPREQVKALPPNRKVYLVLKNVQAASPPGVHYDLYLDLPQGATPSHDLPNYVGTINFFGVTMMRDKMAAMKPRTFSFDVTEKVKTLQAKGELTATPAVSLVPQGEADEKAKATIGQIQLVSQ